MLIPFFLLNVFKDFITQNKLQLNENQYPKIKQGNSKNSFQVSAIDKGGDARNS